MEWLAQIKTERVWIAYILLLLSMMMMMIMILTSYYVRRTTHTKCREDKRPEKSSINWIYSNKLMRRLERQFHNFGSDLNSICDSVSKRMQTDCVAIVHWVSPLAITGLYGHCALSVASCYHRSLRWTVLLTPKAPLLFKPVTNHSSANSGQFVP